MEIRQRFVIKFFSGFSIGMSVSVAVCIYISGRTNEDIHGIELLKQLIGSGIFGAVAMGGSIAYDIEEWGIAKAVFLHYTVAFIAFLAANSILGWFSDSHGLLVLILMFTAAYLFVWLTITLSYARRIHRMNEDLKLFRSK